jgi:hypothetical protein
MNHNDWLESGGSFCVSDPTLEDVALLLDPFIEQAMGLIKVKQDRIPEAELRKLAVDRVLSQLRVYLNVDPAIRGDVL